MDLLGVSRYTILLATALCSSLVHPEDLNRLYHEDHTAFFERWETQARLAATCAQLDSTSRFLREAVEMLGNSEVTEANAELIERLCVERPDCFLRALYSLPSGDQDRLLAFFIVTPLYRERSEIEDALRPYWEEGKYRGLYERFTRLGDGR
jgi:hypothetical protein